MISKRRRTRSGNSHSSCIDDTRDKWFDNSFSSHGKRNRTSSSQRLKNNKILNHGDEAKSTPPKTKNQVIKSKSPHCLHDSFNDSDTLFADLDIDSIEKDYNSGEEKKKEISISLKDEFSTDLDEEAGKLYTPRSFSDRLKRKLGERRSARKSSPSVQKLKKEALVKSAIEQATLLQSEFLTQDIGPFYGLPSDVQNLLKIHRGIDKVYDWQDECLSLPAVRAGKNLIYSLPTSGGKTLVAELLIFKELLCKKHDAILVLPYVAIVQEKVKTLSPFAVDLGFAIEEYAANKGVFPPRKHKNKKCLFICTIEKSNSLINSLIETSQVADLGLIVVDELHMLGEGGSRGAVLEMALTKVLHLSETIQIIGMSATLSNMSDLSKFLRAEIYSNDFRPVKLTEFVKMEDTIYEVKSSALCDEERFKHSRVVTYPYTSDMLKSDPDHLAGLVNEVIPEHSCLVFCPTKKNCENVAELLCKLLPSGLSEVKTDERKQLLSALWHDGNGQVCPVLKKTIQFGIAYHHSGLTTDERKLIEEAYTVGTLCLLCCTSTLAAGVNLPAKRVILRSPHVGLQFIQSSQYKQMIGRAGRAGIDTSGESILIIAKQDKSKISDLISGPMSSCRSSLLYNDCKGVRELLLTCIGLKITTTLDQVVAFLKQTLCYIQSEQLSVCIDTQASESLEKLSKLGLITQLTKPSESGSTTTTTTILEITNLGRAIFKGSIDVDRGPQLYSDLSRAQLSLVIANRLHLLFLITPYDLAEDMQINWMTYFDQINALSEPELKVLSLIGVPASYVCKRVNNQRTNKKVDEIAVHRFYLTLILYQLWQQHGLWQVSRLFQVPRGFIQNLLTSAASLSACVYHFCRELEEFWAYQDLFQNFSQKVAFCSTPELLDLLEIPGVKIGRARQLYKAGYQSLQHVSHANIEDFVQKIDHMPRSIAKQIIFAAKMLITDKAEALREEADELVALNPPPPQDQANA